MNSKLSYAVAAILGSATFGPAVAAPAPEGPDAGANPAAAPDSTDTLGEITVTAQRRSQNMQDVPISMQAFTAQTLQQLNVSTLDDYIKYLPNVTSANNGPGQNEVFMRGLSAGSQPSQGSGSTGLWPNVAIYLDNQSGQLPNRNLDIYAADLNRIEVLEGPQGTLFGAGAEAGVIRYITNEPKLDVTEGNVKAGYGVTAHGNPNTDVTAVLNLPLIENTLAVRGVIYDDARGGYINNVPATFTRHDTDIGIHYANYPAVNGQCPDGGANSGYCVPPGSPSINNYTNTGNAINPVTYEGIRVEALYKINDDWNALITQSYQDMETRGVFYQQPNASDGAALQPLEVTLFNPSYDKDKFESTAWTLNGKIGDLRLVYTGGYLVRNVDQLGDYTNYARGVYADYYQCYGPGTGSLEGLNGGAGDTTLKSTCFSPSAFWHSTEKNEHQQHEFRISTPDDWRFRAIAGAFWEANKLYDQTDWNYKTIPACTSNGASGTAGNSGCLSNIGTVPTTTVVNPGEQSSTSSFYQDTMRETKQTAFFVSLDYDLIPKVLTATLGTRYFHFENSSVGSVTGSFDCFEQGNPVGGCVNDGYNLNSQNLRDTETGFKSRANLTWHITPDTMVYYTFSQGFRPGGFNQNGGTAHALGTDGVDQYLLPKSYLSDKLTNNEIGWKTEFFDHRLQWNGAIYREDWDNVQVAFFDPGLVGNIFYNANGQNFLIKGLETSLVGRVIPGLTLQGAASWNQSRQTNSPVLIDNNPASNNYGKPITTNCNLSPCVPVTNPFGPIGSPSANAPPLQFSLRGRYDWDIAGYSPYVQVGATHNGHSFTQAGSNPTIAQAGSVSTSRLRFENPAYSTFEASFGVAKDSWIFNVYGENLGNSNASTFISTDQFVVAETPLRPRVIGASFSYKF
jgi:outer membrane receptor protein involved in Fe transport